MSAVNTGSSEGGLLPSAGGLSPPGGSSGWREGLALAPCLRGGPETQLPACVGSLGEGSSWQKVVCAPDPPQNRDWGRPRPPPTVGPPQLLLQAKQTWRRQTGREGGAAEAERWASEEKQGPTGCPEYRPLHASEEEKLHQWGSLTLGLQGALEWNPLKITGAIQNGSGRSLVAQRVKRLPAMRETRVRSLGREDPLEKEMASHSSTLAWKIPWTEEPGRVATSRTRLSDFTFFLKNGKTLVGIGRLNREKSWARKLQRTCKILTFSSCHLLACAWTHTHTHTRTLPPSTGWQSSLPLPPSGWSKPLTKTRPRCHLWRAPQPQIVSSFLGAQQGCSHLPSGRLGGWPAPSSRLGGSGLPPSSWAPAALLAGQLVLCFFFFYCFLIPHPQPPGFLRGRSSSHLLTALPVGFPAYEGNFSENYF